MAVDHTHDIFALALGPSCVAVVSLSSLLSPFHRTLCCSLGRLVVATARALPGALRLCSCPSCLRLWPGRSSPRQRCQHWSPPIFALRQGCSHTLILRFADLP